MNPDTNRISDSLNENLSGLRLTERQRGELMKNITGGIHVKKKLNTALALVCALVILSAAALAVTLVSRSEASGATLAANHALEEKYGLTAQTRGLFVTKAQQTDDGWTVDYIPHGYAPVLLGQYQVLIKDGGVVSVAWSYDGTTADLEGGSLTSPVWGHKQLEMALQNPDEASAVSAPLYEEAVGLPTPDAADMNSGDAWWLGEVVHPSQPGKEDMTQEAAQAIAFQAVMEEYALTQAELDGAVSVGEDHVVPMFYTRAAGNPIWTFSLLIVKDGVDQDIAVVIDARTGEVLLTDLLTGGNG